MNSNPISHKTTTKSILDLCNLYRGGNLDLEPGFQRQSVWIERDRAKLIDSILRNYPLPAIFLYRRNDNTKQPATQSICEERLSARVFAGTAAHTLEHREQSEVQSPWLH